MWVHTLNGIFQGLQKLNDGSGKIEVSLYIYIASNKITFRPLQNEYIIFAFIILSENALLRFTLISSYHLRIGLGSNLFPRSSSAEMYTYLLCTLLARCPVMWNLQGPDDGVQLETLGLWALSIVRNSGKYEKRGFGNWVCFCLQMRRGRHSVCYVPQKDLTNLRLAPFKGLSRVRDSRPSELDRNNKFSKRQFSVHLELQTKLKSLSPMILDFYSFLPFVCLS